MKRFAALATALVMILSMLTACGGASTSESSSSSDPTFTFKVGHVQTAEHPYTLGLQYFADLLEERSDGKMKVEIYVSSQLGNESDLIEGMQLGTVDMALTATAPLANFSNSVVVLDLPYLFESKEHAFNVLDSEIGDEMFQELETAGIKGLAYFDNGFMFIHTSTGPIVTPDDMAGLKIRCMENPLHMSFLNETGATATPIAFSEVYTALQNKTVDGSVNSLAAIYCANIHSPAPYMSYTNHIYATAPLMMSMATWDKLPAEYQEIVMECAAEATTYQREAVAEFDADLEETMSTEGGCTFNDVDIDAFKQVVYEKVWPEFVGSTISEDLVARIQAMA